MNWFRRLADIPGVAYAGSLRVDRGNLPGHDIEPTATNYDFDGEGQAHMRWPRSDEESSASPASRHAYQEELSDLASAALVRRLEEALELPGEPRDYHFIMATYCEEAYKRRKEHPAVLAEVERFCLVDVELVEAFPGAVQNVLGEFYHVPSYGRLTTLYEREGFLREALEISERGLAHGQDFGRKVEELRGRVAALEAEDAG